MIFVSPVGMGCSCSPRVGLGVKLGMDNLTIRIIYLQSTPSQSAALIHIVV